MKVSVWDDDTCAALSWKSLVEEVLSADDVDVQAHERTTIVDELNLLHKRRKAYLEQENLEGANEASLLDDTDVLIVDNDLFELDKFNDLSAEIVASLASVYTTCGYIVVLNLHPDLDFNLSLLGHPNSKADLHINDRFVADEGLWKQCPKADGSFRPWHWPLLPAAVELQKTRVTELCDLLESTERKMPILEFFCFSEAAKNRLSRSARAFLHPAKRAEEVSFLDFTERNVTAVNMKDGQKIRDRNDVDKVARIGVRRISKWLARLVLGPQDVLIDFPHIVEKFPFLIPSDHQESADYWNSCSTLSGAPIEDVLGDVSDKVFQRQVWFDRPVFWADQIATEDNLEKLVSTLGANPQDLVFCEDSSAFHTLGDCKRFVAAHHSTSDNRFIRWLDCEGTRIKYGPQSRLAM